MFQNVIQTPVREHLAIQQHNVANLLQCASLALSIIHECYPINLALNWHKPWPEPETRCLTPYLLGTSSLTSTESDLWANHLWLRKFEVCIKPLESIPYHRKCSIWDRRPGHQQQKLLSWRTLATINNTSVPTFNTHPYIQHNSQTALLCVTLKSALVPRHVDRAPTRRPYQPNPPIIALPVLIAASGSTHRSCLSFHFFFNTLQTGEVRLKLSA